MVKFRLHDPTSRLIVLTKPHRLFHHIPVIRFDNYLPLISITIKPAVANDSPVVATSEKMATKTPVNTKCS